MFFVETYKICVNTLAICALLEGFLNFIGQKMQNGGNSRRSMIHLGRERSLQGEHDLESPLQLFSKAKTKINKIFQEITGYLEEASSFLEEKCYVSEEFVDEVDKSSNEVIAPCSHFAGSEIRAVT